MISLKRSGARMSFEINYEVVRREKLDVSSKLLRLATAVHGGPDSR